MQIYSFNLFLKFYANLFKNAKAIMNLAKLVDAKTQAETWQILSNLDVVTINILYIYTYPPTVLKCIPGVKLPKYTYTLIFYFV